MSKILIVDNYDSFTHNLASLVHASTGQWPDVVTNDTDLDSLELNSYAAVIVSPGPGTPERETDFGISSFFASGNSGLPTLGVCLGHQGIAALGGGLVVPASEIMHGRIDRVRHSGSAIFEGIPAEFEVVRYHSLAVERLPEHLTADAWSEDGTVMALSHRSLPLWGVQFHPESIDTEYGLRIIQNFLALSDVSPLRQQNVAGSPDRRALEESPDNVEECRDIRLGPRGLRLLWRRVDTRAAGPALYTHFSSSHPDSFWLDSAIKTDRNHFSYIGDGSGPLAHTVTYSVTDGCVRLTTQSGISTFEGDIFEYLAQQMSPRPFRCRELPFDFLPGYVGYLGYELKALCGGVAEHESSLPDANLLFADRYVAIDELTGAAYTVACYDEAVPETRKLQQDWMDEVSRLLLNDGHSGDAHGDAYEAGTDHRRAVAVGRHDELSYKRLVGRVKSELQKGESYEITLTNTYQLGLPEVDAKSTYCKFREASPALYGGVYVGGGVALCSNSPELFLSVGADGWVESHPIKGTKRRLDDPIADQAAADELRSSAKEVAENRMIVDLVRNDLARVCDPGSVHVPHLFRIESFGWVHHLVSRVRGRLRSTSCTADVIKSCFPGGSMTGAPKIRSMQIIDMLEAGPRGPYSGGFGYLSLAGSCTLAMVIRSVVSYGGRTTIGAGGAITWLSDVDAEFDEVNLKLEGIAANTVATQQAQSDE